MNDLDPPEPRRWPRRLALILSGVLLLFGPWPVDDSTFEGSAYQARTLDRVDGSPSIGPDRPIRVGVAEVDLTPESPRPLAGFIGQILTPFVAVDTPCVARALSVESRGNDTFTILTADLLLINAKLARAVCDRAGVRLDQVYFTASHTHGGPGGWGDHPLEMLVAGAYDPGFFDELAEKLAEVVRRSKIGLEPAEVGFVQVQARGRQINRVDRALPTHDALSALIFRTLKSPAESPPLAILASFGAHATVSHPVPPRLGGDYPASLASELKRRTDARSVLFAAGAVGDASPTRPKAVSQAGSAEILGSYLADDLMAALPSARFSSDVPVGNLRVVVDLPPVRLPFFASWLRFSPLATWWIADRRTHLHAIRIGPAVLVGFPGDYSGHLANRLVGSIPEGGPSVVVTSFDGDFRGYLVSSEIYRGRSCYETRHLNFYGPWAGDYLNDLARRMIGRLSRGSIGPSRPSPNGDDLAPRAVLAVLLLGSLAVGWRHRGEAGVLIVRVGSATVAIALAAAVAFEVSPDLVAWAKVGIPWWTRMIGVPLGAYALTLPRRGEMSRAALLLGSAAALLSSSWVVALMIPRGWARAGLKPRSKGGATSASSAS